MTLGTLYGIGVGPGDPELMTVKGSRIIYGCKHIFVPKAKMKTASLALEIAGQYISPHAEIHELVFPMSTDQKELTEKWTTSARAVAAILQEGENVCFLTLGDALLYSTYIYLLRAIKEILPDLVTQTIPGITAMSAAASLIDFPIGEGKFPVSIIPTADDLQSVSQAIEVGGTVVLMKIGKRLPGILDLLDEKGVIDQAVLISRVGHPEERVETDLNKLKTEGDKIGYFSIMLIDCNK